MNIIEYLERNIKLIDSDLTSFFINVYTDCINDDNLNEMIHILDVAEIESKRYRELAMHYILTRIFEDYQGEDTFLDYWIRSNLINYFGFEFEEIFNYIIENKNDFCTSDLEIINTGNYWKVRFI